MDQPDADQDDQFVELLVAYDTQLAAGSTSLDGLQQRSSAAAEELPNDGGPTVDSEGSQQRSSGLAEQLEDAKICLLRLARIWPRTKLPDFELPEAVGRFQIVRELGRGGFGIVYLASDPKLGRLIALKVQRPEAILSKTLRGRFMREAKAAARLHHPNIAGVYEVDEAGLQVWIAEEYCDGDSLAAWLRVKSSQVAPRSAATFMAALADAMEYSHQQGVLHRDLKPSNVLLQRHTTNCVPQSFVEDDLSAYIPKLIDFGLAKLRESQHDETRSGALLGTPAYMAPEQASGEVRHIVPATDVYALGAILYELLTGSPVFCGTSDADTLRRIVADEPTPPRLLRPDIPRDLEAICLRCLEKDPRRRYETAAALAADLRRFLASIPTLARPLTVRQRVIRWAVRRPALAGLLIVSFVACVTLATSTMAYVARLSASNKAAEASRIAAESSALQARQQEAIASRYMYVSQMRQAYEWLAQGQVDRARLLLAKYELGPLAELRGFEWYHLKGRLDGSRLTLRGHRGEVYAVAFSPEGRVLASGGEDGTIRLWDPASGQELATIAAHASCANVLAYSPDGQILVSASCDHTVKLWQATTHELLATLDGHADEVHGLAFSTDGSLLATGGKDGEALVWDMPSRKVFKRLDVRSHINALAWLRGGRRLAILAESVVVWDLDSDRRSEGPRLAHSVAIPPGGSSIILGLATGDVRVVSEDLATELETLTGHAGRAADALAITANGDWLASGSSDNTIRIWGRNAQRGKQTLVGHEARVQALAFSSERDMLASASFDGTVKLWNIRSESLPRHVERNSFLFHGIDQGQQVAISPDLRYLACLHSDHDLSVFAVSDAGGGSRIGNISFAPVAVSGLNFIPGDEPVLFGVPSNNSQTWSQPPRRISLGKLPESTGRPARNVIWSSTGRHLIATEQAGVTIVDSQTGQAWCQIDAKPKIPGFPSVRFSPDAGALMVSAWIQGQGQGAELTSWIVDLNAKRHWKLADRQVIAVGNGAKLIAWHIDGASMAVIEPASGREICTLRHDAAIAAAAFAPDLRTVATCTNNGYVYLWNIATGETITRFEANSVGAFKLQFSTDGRKLAALTWVDDSTTEQRREGTLRLFVWEGVDDL